jgi:hypothetical protein
MCLKVTLGYIGFEASLGYMDGTFLFSWHRLPCHTYSSSQQELLITVLLTHRMCVHAHLVSVATIPTLMLPKRGVTYEGSFGKQQYALTDQQRQKRVPSMATLCMVNGKIPNLKFQGQFCNFGQPFSLKEACLPPEGPQQQWQLLRCSRQSTHPETCLFTMFLSLPLSLSPSLFS